MAETTLLNKTSNLRLTSCPSVKCSSSYTDSVQDLWSSGNLLLWQIKRSLHYFSAQPPGYFRATPHRNTLELIDWKKPGKWQGNMCRQSGSLPFQDCAEESEPSVQSPASSREASAKHSQSSLPLRLKVRLLLKQHNMALQPLPSYFTGWVPEHFCVPIFQLIYMHFPILHGKIK